MNTRLMTEKELRSQMRSAFTNIFPNRSTEGLEDAMSGSPGPRATDHQKKEWILEMAKMSLLAENHLDPASDQDSLQNAIAQIDEMVASINIEYTDEEFYQAVREKYGSRGVRQAKRDIERLDIYPNNQLSPEEQLLFRQLMMELFMDSKERAREKFTPKKYREKLSAPSSVCPG